MPPMPVLPSSWGYLTEFFFCLPFFLFSAAAEQALLMPPMPVLPSSCNKPAPTPCHGPSHGPPYTPHQHAERDSARTQASGEFAGPSGQDGRGCGGGGTGVERASAGVGDACRSLASTVEASGPGGPIGPGSGGMGGGGEDKESGAKRAAEAWHMDLGESHKKFRQT
jgi:hypothetical protein